MICKNDEKSIKDKWDKLIFDSSFHNPLIVNSFYLYDAVKAERIIEESCRVLRILNRKILIEEFLENIE
jgi:hypothetical protein